MKRLLILTNMYPSMANPIGGTFVTHRVSALRSIGVECIVVAVGVEKSAKGSSTIHVDYDFTTRAGPLSRAALRIRPLARMLERSVAQRIVSNLKSDEFGAVVAHGNFRLGAGAIARQISHRWTIPYSVHFHGSDINVHMKERPDEFLPVMHEAQACMFVSQRLLDVSRSLGYRGDAFLVTGNGVNPEVFHPPASNCRQPVVSFIGNLLPVKGADLLPKIWEHFKSINPEYRLRVIGDGPLRIPLEKALAGKGVEFLGRIPPTEVAAAMRDSRLVILPSRSEGWPTVINESYATGTPVVAADVGGCREAIADPASLVSTGANFETRFAQAMNRIASRETVDHLRVLAREHSWTAISEQEFEMIRG